MKQLILILVMLSTAGCDPPVRRSEAESIAEDMADAHTSGLQARVEELEQKLSDLEELNQKGTDFSASTYNLIKAESEARRVEVNGLRDHYNDHLVRFHGAPR